MAAGTVGAYLPPPFDQATDNVQLVTQGAEAFLYRTTFLSHTRDCALKYRPSKPYRHPTLDKRLTRQRILAEARVLVRCQKDGIDVPGVLGLDCEAGWLATEWIEGQVVRAALQDMQALTTPTRRDSVKGLLQRIGRAVARLHSAGIVHGDLTTSNMMLRPRLSAVDSTSAARCLSTACLPGEPSVNHLAQVPETPSGSLDGDVVLIDFGLAQQTLQDEDRAVDLYVLERAFGSTHPESEHFFEHLLDAYALVYTGATTVVKRLADVRQRGRKKSMIG